MDMQVDSRLIRSEREKRAWSQSHLASVSALGLRTVQRIERTGRASFESAAAIAAALTLTVAELNTGNAVDSANTDTARRPRRRPGATRTSAAQEWVLGNAGGISLAVSLVALALVAYSASRQAGLVQQNATAALVPAASSTATGTDSDSHAFESGAPAGTTVATEPALHIVDNAVVARAYGPDWVGPEGAMGVWGGAATAADLQTLRPGSADDRFETEPIDPVWAREMEATIYFAVSATTDDFSLISEVRCRTTVCRAIVDYGKSLRRLDRASRRQHFERASALLVDSFKPLISEPDGRLDRWVSAVESSVDGDVAIYTLTGPSYAGTASAER